MAKMAPAAIVARSALFTYLTPRLAMDAQINYDGLVQGITSRSYNNKKADILKAVRSATKGKLAQDADIMDLANLLDALSPSAQQADAMVGAPPPMQQAPPAQLPPNSAAPPPAQLEEDDNNPHDVVAKIKAYLEEQGVSPEILQNLDAFLAQPEDPKPDVGDPTAEQPAAEPPPAPEGGEAPPPKKEGEDNALAGQTAIHGLDGDMTDIPGLDNELEDMVAAIDPVNKPSIIGSGENPTIVTSDEDEEDEEAEDGVIPETQEGQVVTKAAMDAAIRQAQDSAIKNQRNIRNAERYVRPWVGDLAMDAARPSDVLRGALKALGMDSKKVDKLHPDALQPILDNMPRPSRRVPQQQQSRMAADSKPAGSFLERFPMAKDITVQ